MTNEALALLNTIVQYDLILNIYKVALDESARQFKWNAKLFRRIWST